MKFTVNSIERYLIALRNHSGKIINVNYKKQSVRDYNIGQEDAFYMKCNYIDHVLQLASERYEFVML